MSQANVERVIGRLVTDEAFRRRFAEGREALLRELVAQGFELTWCELEVLGELVQVPRRGRLRPKHHSEPVRRERVDRAVVQHTRRVHHGGEIRDTSEQRRHGLPITGVTGAHHDVRTEAAQLRHEVRGTRCR